MIAPAFVDTNVFVYARDPVDPVRHAVARAWIDHLWRERAGRTSVQVLNELYSVMTRKLRPALDSNAAWAGIQPLLGWNPEPIDSALLVDAHGLESRFRIAWWDALIVAAAIRQGCGVLLSEDFQDGMQFGPVRVMNPFTHRVGEHAAVYAALPRAAALHRGRGRPRKAKVA